MSAKDELFIAWDGLVTQHGFRKSRSIHTLPLGKDWQGWLGLNSASYQGAGPVDVLPVVGVRWKPLEQVFRELNPQLPKSVSPTLSQPLSYELVKGPHNGAQWRVRDATGEPFHLEEVLDDVVRWGIPFMESLCDPEGVVEKLRPPSHFNPNPGLPLETYPIALVLTGRQAEAVDFVREHQREAANRPDPASRDYVAYADRFLEKYA
ncbi:hypothetical protein KKR91_07945 [Arthrobacter jiangjiafuii]|uniref:Uncharacterized protein n=1 Tax=Arthrobacter jiangjiafuii TaxID=2817475 RepID=A0A975R2D1_9MICC|nr:hypothetical protein [Arthrobacter jiangjiafuii]MBP3042934.1 hypothetical protein [Arthrobacter jiangjiafuii]QWC11463.1 hypothetical protein KKR91_07945 [Arthrobacter jiangjiafuii]